MNVNVSFHRVQHSDALEFFIQEKSKKLNKFIQGHERLNWVVDFQDKHFKPRLNISLNGKFVSVKSKADNAFVAVNEVMSKAMRLLSKHHGKKVRLH